MPEIAPHDEGESTQTVSKESTRNISFQPNASLVLWLMVRKLTGQSDWHLSRVVQEETGAVDKDVVTHQSVGLLADSTVEVPED